MTNSSPLGKEKQSSGEEEADDKLPARQLWFGAGFQGEQGCPNASWAGARSYARLGPGNR